MSKIKEKNQINIEDEIEKHLGILDKPMPVDEEAESGILSCLLQDPSKITEFQQLNKKDFLYHNANKIIATHLLRLYDEGSAIDPMILTSSLRESNELDIVGGAAAISELYGYSPLPNHFPFYAKLLETKRLLRELVRKSALIMLCAQSHIQSEKSIEMLISESEDLILSIRGGSNKDFQHVKSSAIDAIETIQFAMDNPGKLAGVSSGFKKLDYLTTGLKGGDMFVIAARPSMGKTSLLMNIVEHVALVDELPVAIFSLEVQAAMLTRSLICRMAGLSLNDVSNGIISRGQQQALAIAVRKIQMSNIFIDDTSAIDIKMIKSKSRRLKKTHPKLALIAIDYLQLATCEDEGYREQEISKISSGIKALAKELNVPIIVLAQLNRAVENRKEKRPMLSDLRESGSIEQDADMVGLLTRSGYYGNKQPDDDEIVDDREAKLILAKNRNGPTDDVDMLFIKEITRFTERDQQ